MNVVLLSLYDMGRQPFGLASPAAWLKEAGASVSCQDLTIQRLDEEPIRSASLVGLHLPMHTATRMAANIIERIRVINPSVHICCYGLYAPLNEEFLCSLGVQMVLGGEFEEGLTTLVGQLDTPDLPRVPLISLAKQHFITPDRAGLPELSTYAFLDKGDGEHHITGYTEASRGCKHLCRHCPIVPVYQGAFRIVQREVVLADIRQQVAAGAAHITFGDPDFFNGPGHALAIVEALHAEFPTLTYDVTIKVEHLLQHQAHLDTLARTGCLFIISAVESLDDRVLQTLDKGHTKADFEQALALCRKASVHMQPTFVAFHPWLSLGDYMAFLQSIAQLGLIEAIAPIQYAIRLLIPTGSRLLELDEVQQLVEPFDQASLAYPWAHPEPQVDWLQQTILSLVQEAEQANKSRFTLFSEIWHLTRSVLDEASAIKIAPLPNVPLQLMGMVPRLSENWYC